MAEGQAMHASPILEADDSVEAVDGDHDRTQSSLVHDAANLTLGTSSSPAIPIPGRTSAASVGGKESTGSIGARMDDIQVGESAAGQSVRMQLPARALQQILEAESADNVLTPRNDIGPFAF